ncbi:MAG: hypothetical protein HY840_02165 [Bacteroidetes bacterium]|nr:hypothetical protein [Bacteroidota bacterium]
MMYNNEIGLIETNHEQLRGMANSITVERRMKSIKKKMATAARDGNLRSVSGL